MYFAVDAFLAAIIIVLGLIVASTFFINRSPRAPIDYLSSDIINTLSYVQIGAVNNLYLDTLRSQGYVTPEKEQYSILEFIARLYIDNHPTEVTNLVRNLTGPLIPYALNLQITLDGQTIYSNVPQAPNEIGVGRRMVSGIGISKPLSGFTARAVVAGIGAKDNVDYEYFGGKSGFGNITKKLFNLPDDASVYNITIKASPYSDSQWYLNGVNCRNISASALPFQAQTVTASACLPYISNNNEMSVLFSSPTLSSRYLQGAIVEINYSTQQFVDPQSGPSTRFYLDGINGVIDHATGFLAKGLVTSVAAYLHFENDGLGSDIDKDDIVEPQPILYVRVGNVTVFQTNKSSLSGMWLDWDDLSSQLNWNAQTTFPLFIGYNNTPIGSILGGGADVFFVTGISNSTNLLFNNLTSGKKGSCTYTAPGNASNRRLGFTKCGLRVASSQLLSNPLSRVGLIAYETSEYNVSKVNLTNNELLIYGTIGLDDPLYGYDATSKSSSCVCCGINAARNDLVRFVQRVTMVYNHSMSWKYVTVSPAQGWQNVGYDDSGWNLGNAVLGANYSKGEKINGTWASTINGLSSYPNMSEVLLDRDSPAVEFTNGLSFTGNTFGADNVSDGWDSVCGGSLAANNCGSALSGTWINTDTDYDGNQNDNLVQNQSELRVEFKDIDGDGDINNQQLLAASFGVPVWVNKSVADIVSSRNGNALLRLRLRISHTQGNWSLNGMAGGVDGESLWIKGRLGKNGSSMADIGSDIDRSNLTADATPEIFWCRGLATQYQINYTDGLSEKMPYENSCLPFIQEKYVEINVTDVIKAQSNGSYYLELSAKLFNNIALTNSMLTTEWIVGFDDIELMAYNTSDNYYLRKSFSWTNPFVPEYGIMNAVVDDRASFWLNGHRVDKDAEPRDGVYWNRRGLYVPGFWIKNGTNVIAAQVENFGGQSKFDLEFHVFNKYASRNIVVSMDGNPSVTCSEQGSGNAVDDALNASCQALERWGIKTSVMATSSLAEPETIRNLTCRGGVSFMPGDIDNPLNYYASLGKSLDESASKAYENSGAAMWGNSILYPDSYIEVNVTPFSGGLQYGELTISRNLASFSGCNGGYTLPAKLRFLDGFVYSVPGPAVNAFLNVNETTVYNWSDWGRDFAMQGNPMRMYAEGFTTGYSGFIFGEDNGIAPNPVEIIIDNNDPDFKAEPNFFTQPDDETLWDESYLGDYAMSDNPLSKDKCTWSPNFDIEGNYALYIWSPRGHSDFGLVEQQITVNHKNGSDEFTIDYSESSPTAGAWNNLGTFSFGDGSSVVQTNEDENTPMACDTVKLVLDTGAAECSNVAGLFGKLALKADSGFSPVLPISDGCTWEVSFSSGNTLFIPVPSNYTGIKNCKYGPGGIAYSANNSIQVATFQLLQNLDWDDNLLVDLNINDIYAELDSISIDEAPYMWGPAIIEVRAWY